MKANGGINTVGEEPNLLSFHSMLNEKHWLNFDSFVKNSNKLVKNSGPVADRHDPFFRYFKNRQINRLFQCIIRWERHFVFGVFSDFSVEIFNQICGIIDRSNFKREVKKSGQLIPVIIPVISAFNITSRCFIS